ncbi:MAG: SNF2 helicase-associated domain-containing protein, partial [Acetatifactor sp.]|nr:SNF2 helicase-associated domain-containing protein [Acetatifactor sp.]
QLDGAGCFLYRLSDAFFRVLTDQPDLELTRAAAVVQPDADLTARLLDCVPFTLGSEHVTEKWITHIFKKLNEIYAQEIQSFDGTVAMYLAEKSQRLKVPERIFFHLVESKEDDYPFAFLATYATRDRDDKVRHVPLQYALTEYKKDRNKLMELLSCLNQVAEVSEIIGEFVEKGEMFHPLRLTSQEAYRILLDIPAIEEAGIVCRIPNWWRKNAYNVSMSINLGEEKPTFVGLDSILSMCPQLTVDGIPLTQKEIRDLLAQTEGLAFLKGKWIEVNHQKLNRLLDEMQQYEGDLTLLEALRMGLGSSGEDKDADVGRILTNGKWLSQLLQSLRSPGKIRPAALPKRFKAQ